MWHLMYVTGVAHTGQLVEKTGKVGQLLTAGRNSQVWRKTIETLIQKYWGGKGTWWIAVHAMAFWRSTNSTLSFTVTLSVLKQREETQNCDSTLASLSLPLPTFPPLPSPPSCQAGRLTDLPPFPPPTLPPPVTIFPITWSGGKPTSLSSFLRGSPAATGIIGTGSTENNSTGRPRRILLPLRAHISALWPSPVVLSNDSCRPDNLLVSLSCLQPPQGVQFQSNP